LEEIKKIITVGIIILSALSVWDFGVYASFAK